MLKGVCVNSYPKRGADGKVRKMFVFKVTGTEDEIAEYLEIQEKRFPAGKWQDEDGNVFYWTSSPSGSTIKLNITTNGNVVEDTTNIDLDAAAKARYDHTYDSVRAGLANAGTGIAPQPKEQAEKNTDLGN